jgi:uncharacterized membrane protein
MAALILGLVLFLGVHSVRIVADGWRGEQVARLGEGRWKVLYSLVAAAGLALIVWGYGMARAEPAVLFVPAPWTRHLAALLSALAFVLIAAAYIPGTRIKAAIGHPMVAGVKSWALAHLISNGTLADLLLFGAFLAWAVVDFASLRRRDRAQGRTYAAVSLGRDAAAVAVGLAAGWVFARYLHGPLIGVQPFV